MPRRDILQEYALFLYKDGHRYRIRYDGGQEGEVIKHFDCMATNPDLNFSWEDAVDLSHEVGRNLVPSLKRIIHDG